MVGVSACLLGFPCRYDGKHKKDEELLRSLKGFGVIPFCPEVFGGLSIPRVPAFIDGGTGKDVWEGRARVVSLDGRDLTEEYKKGAEFSLMLLENFGVYKVYLKEKSPSCGLLKTYSTGNILVDGEGVTAYLLRKKGFILRSR